MLFLNKRIMFELIHLLNKKNKKFKSKDANKIYLKSKSNKYLL